MPNKPGQWAAPRWTETEDSYLVENWQKKSAREIANKTGRARSAVLGRARRLGLSKSAAEHEPVGWRTTPERPQPSLAKLRFMGEI